MWLRFYIYFFNTFGTSSRIFSSHFIDNVPVSHLRSHEWHLLVVMRHYSGLNKEENWQTRPWKNTNLFCCGFGTLDEAGWDDLEGVLRRAGDNCERLWDVFLPLFSRTHTHQSELLLGCFEFCTGSPLLNVAPLTQGIAEYLCMSEPRRNHHYCDGGPCRVHLK